MSGSGQGVTGLEAFDGDLLDKLKSSFVPPFIRNPTTTIYVVPKTIANVQPDAYRVREVPLSMHTRFESTFPRANLPKFHAPSHVFSILNRNPSKKFEDYVMAMYELRDEIQACHLLTIPIDFQCFIHAVFSGCHVVDNLLNFYEGKLTSQVDQICSTGLHYMWVDYILVENQIPFSILQKIYDMAIDDHAQYPTFIELCLQFFEQFLDINRQRPLKDPKSVHHLLHLVHHYLLPTDPPPKTWNRFTPPRSASMLALIIKPFPAARRLLDCGIKFKKKKGIGFSEITFHKGVLEIPYLRIDVNTRFLLRNMVAWEQCHPGAGSYFTSYAIFMDYLINTEEDVEILNRSGIIEQTLGSETMVADIFNGLSTNIVYNGNGDDFLAHLCGELSAFCQSKFRTWQARLMIDYFSNPWAIISVIAGIYLLILTSIQTFYSGYVYYRPR